jgi:hypothetical protein
MKSILFISSTLMAGACIYGFVDYKSTNRKKEFKSLYRNETTETKSSVSPNRITEIKTLENVNEKITPGEVSDKSANVQAEEKKTAGTKKTVGIKRKVTTNKKLSFKKYSRAALENIEEVPVSKQKQ